MSLAGCGCDSDAIPLDLWCPMDPGGSLSAWWEARVRDVSLPTFERST